MDEKVQAILNQLTKKAGAIYIIDNNTDTVIYANEKCRDMLGMDALGMTVEEVLKKNPHVRNALDNNNAANGEWEYYDTIDKRMYKISQVNQFGYRAAIADNITEILELNCAVTDYLRLMNCLSDMQTELVSNQDRIFEILIRTMIEQFRVKKVYISYIDRKNQLVLWTSDDGIQCNIVKDLPDGISKLKPYIVNVANTEYQFRIVSYNESDINENYEIVLNLAGIYIESARLKEQIEWDSIHDKFTGLYNRAHYIFSASARYETLSSIGVLFVDIDNLKKMNDQCGHHMGDMLIKKIADILLSYMSESIDAYRMGGDEFMLVMQNCSEHDVKEAYEDLIKKVDKSNEDIPEPKLLLSAGYAYEIGAKDAETVIRQADMRMYEQKQKHKSEQI